MAKSVRFAKTEVTRSLKLVKKRYLAAYNGEDNDNNRRLLHLYAGMAIITLSGYLEDGMNGVVDISHRGLSADSQKNLLEGTKRVNGASYDHFRKRLVLAFGYHGLDFIESHVGSSNIVILKSKLGNIKKLRDETAHSHSNTIRRSPGEVLSDFEGILPILKKIEEGARLYRDRHFN